MSQNPVLLGCDEAALDLKETIKAHLQALGVEVIDYGVHTKDPIDYPDIAVAVATDVVAGKSDRAILICGTGIGMAITANKVPGVYRRTGPRHVFSRTRAQEQQCPGA